MKFKNLSLMLSTCLLASASVGVSAADSDIQAPIADKVQWQETRHGEVVTDDYRWLQKKSDPKVIAYLKAENDYTQAMTADIQTLADNLFQEIKGRMKANDLSVPVKRGQFYYYSRFEAGKQYPIFCRRAQASDGQYDDKQAEEILLDQNELAQGQKFMALGGMVISPNARYLAYSTDNTGYRQFRLQVKDLQTGKVSTDLAERVTSMVWANDNQTLMYVQEDATTKRADRLFRQRLGEAATQVYYEADELYRLNVGTTHDRSFIVVTAISTDTYENWLIPTTQPETKPKSLLGRNKGHRYLVEHRLGEFFIQTNDEAKNFRIVTAPVATPDKAHWKTLVPHDPANLLNGFEVFRDYLALREKSQAQSGIRIYDFAKKTWNKLNFKDQVYMVSNQPTPEFNSSTMRIAYQSPATPQTIMEVQLANGERKVLKQEEIVGGYDASRYTTQRIWVKARDGAQVPAWAIYKKDVVLDGHAPLLLYAYGSYGVAMEPRFSLSRLSLLDRGVVYVMAQIRGGSDMGQHWHEDGMLMKKKNTFNDFIDTAEYLIANKWTNKDKLIIQGGSAGGLLMGAVVNMRPDLFKAVHAAVPFVDVMNTMLDTSLPLTVGEYLEWGNPNEKAAYDYMRSYSPYDNLAQKAYPAMLVTTGLNDSQVMYWEPAKYVAKMRSLKTDQHPLLLKVNMDAGHGGASGRYDAIKEAAFEYAWMLGQWGLAK